MAINGSIFTMGALVRSSAARFGESDALVFPDRRMRYDELDADARAWAKALIAAGVKPGDNVGIFLATRIEFVTMFMGIAMAGAVAVPVNARYQSSELRFLVEDADLVMLLTTGRVSDSLDFGERLTSALPLLLQATDPSNLTLAGLPNLRSVICLDTPCPAYLLAADVALARGETISDAELDSRIDAVDPQDGLMIIYTSGTTAQPKGVQITHRGQIGNSRSLGRRFEATAADRLWSPLPIFHTGGISTMTMMLDLGGTYLTAAQFDAGVALSMLGRERATISYPSFVTIMQDLIEHPAFAGTDLSAMRIMNSNFAVQPEWIKHAVMTAMPHITQVGTYGLTEAGGAVSTSRLSDSVAQRTGRCGKPLDEWEVRIVDPESGGDCSPGDKGEIVIRGPNMFTGYYKSPDKSAAAIRGGWFFTGDVGSIDASGDLMFHGRTKDMLKVGGENVAAAEIEMLLQSHPAVKLAQVVGIPDYRYAEVPAAFVELVDGSKVSEAELIEHCRGQLANFKIPRHVRTISEWPMSTSKIQKFKLRERLIEELDQADKTTTLRPKAGGQTQSQKAC